MGWGFEVFFRLRLSGCLNDDRLKIRCELTVFFPAPRTTEDTTAPRAELPSHLERVLREGKGADITFDVAGEGVPRAQGPVRRVVARVRRRALRTRGAPWRSWTCMEPAVFFRSKAFPCFIESLTNTLNPETGVTSFTRQTPKHKNH